MRLSNVPYATHITNTSEMTSIIHWSVIFASDRCLIYFDPGVNAMLVIHAGYGTSVYNSCTNVISTIMDRRSVSIAWIKIPIHEPNRTTERMRTAAMRLNGFYSDVQDSVYNSVNIPDGHHSGSALSLHKMIWSYGKIRAWNYIRRGDKEIIYIMWFAFMSKEYENAITWNTWHV